MLAEEITTGARTPSPDEIRRQLQAVLTSPVFHGSKRCQQFLDYVCQRALAGDSGALKERAVAIEVFGRPPDSGLGEDTIVRVGAREVRKRLAQYYSSPDGLAAPVVIELPLGSYLPDFHYPKAEKTPVSAAEPMAKLTVPITLPSAPAIPVHPSRRWAWIVAAAICIAVLSAGALKWRSRTTVYPAFEAFWAPVTQSESPLLIGVGHPIVYMPSRRATLLNQQRNGPAPFPLQRPLQLDPKELDGSDMVAVENQYLGFGDMVAGNEVSQMLARRGRSVRLLMASSIPFADLRRSPVYLIGSFSNRWSSELEQSWRFQFVWTPDHQPVFRDTQDPRRQWTVPAKADGSTPEDYCLIVRIPHSPTGGVLIVSAGIKQFGTEAAGRLLAEPSELSAVLSKLPAGWESKNMQMLLHARVIGNTPAQPELVAVHVW